MLAKLSPLSHRLMSLLVTGSGFLIYCISFFKCRKWYHDLPEEEQDSDVSSIIRTCAVVLLFWQLWCAFGLTFVAIGFFGIIQRNRGRLRIYILHQLATLALFLLSLVPLSVISVSPTAMQNICAAFTRSDTTWLFGSLPDQETCEEQWRQVTIAALAVSALTFIGLCWATGIVWTYYSGEAWRSSTTFDGASRVIFSAPPPPNIENQDFLLQTKTSDPLPLDRKCERTAN